MAKSVIDGLSLRSIGLLYVMSKHPGIKKVDIMKAHSIGDNSIRAAYKELINASLIELKTISTGRGTITKTYVLANKLKAPQSEVKTTVPKRLKTHKDTPKKRIDAALAFYDDQIEISHGKQHHNAYCNFVTFLDGNNDLGKKLDHILLVPQQLEYDQFEKLFAKATEKGRTIKQLLESMANTTKYTKDKMSLFLTLNSWLNRD